MPFPPTAPQGAAPAPMPPRPMAPPPGAGAPPPAPGQGAAPSVPPDIAQHVDPKNPVQMALIERVEKLTPQDVQAFTTGVSPGAVAVLKKIIPEIAFLIDRAMSKGQPGMAPPGGAPPPMPPPAPPQGPTGLNRI